ncbi:hypothetical protein IKG16_01805, partial [Candidatus Saccharibacteria bacterium]|nr:hypothetical protein [Candidatus Saccharibacteria bacterium]
NNTWGYTLTNLGDNPSQSTLNSTTFSKVELTSTSADSLISSGSKTTGAGDNLPVTYGFMADTKLTPGTYSTQVTYTAIAETPSYTIQSISPARPAYNATNVAVTILTSTPSTELGLGDITATITDGTNTVQLTNCSETIQEVSGTSYRGATCTYPGNLPAGRYNVTLTSSWHNATYTLSNAFSVNSMQEFISTNCTNLVESTTTVDNRIDLVDSRDGKIYKVSKLADGNCWMVSNLALDGLDTNNDPVTLTPSDSNVSSNYTFPANVQQINDGTTASSNNNAQIYTSFQNTTDSYGSKYGNTYNFFAATAGQGTASFMGDTTQSVCPKGWILPRHYFNNPSYYNLITKYLNFPSDPYIFGLDAIPYINRAQQAPLFFPLAKVYLNGMSLTMTGYTGSEATEISSRSRFVMNLDDSSSYMILSNSQLMSEADSVRCVFGN